MFLICSARITMSPRRKRQRTKCASFLRAAKELNGKVYDFVLCEMPEDETQKLTFLLEGEALYAIRITIQMGDSTMQALLTVTAFTEEIPDDIPFELPKGYMEYTYEPYEEIEFPSALPPFDAGTLYSTSSGARPECLCLHLHRTDRLQRIY